MLFFVHLFQSELWRDGRLCVYSNMQGELQNGACFALWLGNNVQYFSAIAFCKLHAAHENHRQFNYSSVICHSMALD